MKVYEIPPKDVKIPPRVMAARLGFKGVGTIPEKFKSFFESAYVMALKSARPRAAVDIFSSYFSQKGIEIDGVLVSGNLARSQLGKSKMVSAILVTLGREIDNEVLRLHEEGRELESFFLDGIASEMVEFATRMIDEDLRSQTTFMGSARISPGYGDLPLKLNLWFAKRMGKILNVTCDEESFTFLPRKTISAFVGWS